MVMGTAKRQMARSETGMVQTGPVKALSGVMGTAKRQMVRSETGKLQTCEGIEWGDGYGEDADGEA